MVFVAREPVLHLERCNALLPPINALEISRNADLGIDLLADLGIELPVSLVRAVAQQDNLGLRWVGRGGEEWVGESTVCEKKSVADFAPVRLPSK